MGPIWRRLREAWQAWGRRSQGPGGEAARRALADWHR
jgi:hypothetical protein